MMTTLVAQKKDPIGKIMEMISITCANGNQDNHSKIYDPCQGLQNMVMVNVARMNESQCISTHNESGRVSVIIIDIYIYICM